MMQRRRFQQANKEAAWRPQPIPESADPLEEAEIEASVAEAMAIYVAECAQRKADAAASAQPQPEPAQPPPAASSPAAPPAQPAIRHQGLAHLPPNPAHRRNAEDRITEILNQAAAAFPAMTYPAPATRHPT
jgi:hypothetical protein